MHSYYITYSLHLKIQFYNNRFIFMYVNICAFIIVFTLGTIKDNGYNRFSMNKIIIF